MAGGARRRADRLRHLELRPGPRRGPGPAVRGAAAPQRPPRRLRRREPRPGRARGRRRAGSSPSCSPTPSSAAPPAPGRPRSPSSEEDAMPDHYDVIIIGTGAGGGTLAHRLAPTGKRVLLLERGGYLPREPENWDSQRGLPQASATSAARSGSTRHGDGLPPAPAVLRRRQHEVLRRDPVPPARAGLRRGPPPRRDLARPGRSPTRTSSPTTPRPSGSTSSTASAARTRPSRRRSGPFPYPAVSHEPRIQQLARRPRGAPGHQPVPPAGRRRPRRERPGGAGAACAATASTGSPA